MRKTGNIVFAALAIVMAIIFINSCSGGKSLRTESVRAIVPAGTFTLILYGGRYATDLETIAFLADEGRYEFEVYAPDFNYQVKKGMPASEALEEAERFIRHHHSFWQSQLRGILDPDKNIIGYEVRPLYLPIDVGTPDVLDVYYALKGNKVIVKIKLRTEVERALSDEKKLAPGK